MVPASLWSAVKINTCNLAGFNGNWAFKLKYVLTAILENTVFIQNITSFTAKPSLATELGSFVTEKLKPFPFSYIHALYGLEQHLYLKWENSNIFLEAYLHHSLSLFLFLSLYIMHCLNLPALCYRNHILSSMLFQRPARSEDGIANLHYHCI